MPLSCAARYARLAWDRRTRPGAPAPGSRRVAPREEIEMAEHDAEHKLAEARRHATEELHKQGTPEYDARAHQRAVEAERKAAEEAKGA